MVTSRRSPSPPQDERSARLVEHRPLVKVIAQRMLARLPANVSLDELLQAGMIGLDEAFTRYEDHHGASFETYAARRVEGAMLDALRANDTLPRSVRARLRIVRQAVQRLEHRLGRVPRAKEVANELSWSLDEFHECMVASGAGGARVGDQALEKVEDELSLATNANDDDLIDEHSDPLTRLQQRQRHAALNSAFDALEEQERYVMRAIYVHGTSLSDIGAALGVSTSRISKMNAEIVAKLKRRLRDW